MITEIPPVVKVFGILHLVFAGLGVISAVWGFFILIVGNPFMRFAQAGSHMGAKLEAQMSAQMEAQLAMQEKIRPISITASILSLLVAIPMIMAGIKLLKKRNDGLKWSNGYAISSLGAKFINLVLSITILIPAMKEMTRGVMAGSHAPGIMEEVMAGAMAGGAIGGILVPCLYPVLTLVLLNRAAPKAWFASLAK